MEIMLLSLILAASHVIQGEIICHQPFGCFIDGPPFDHYLLSNPKHPKHVGTSFSIHTVDRKRTFKNFRNRTIAAAIKMLDAKNLKIIIHGLLESSNKSWVRKMTKGLLKKGNNNVLVMDYGDGATGLKAAGNARLVGAQLAYLLKKIFRSKKIVDGDVHIIGFSLGAHVAGYAGTRLINAGYKLGRITGLDAGDLPYGTRVYENAHPFVRLDTNDADFVDVIHTDIKGLGIDKPIGHLDFYVNGGERQPGCGGIHLLKALGKVQSREDFFGTVGCHHVRAVHYFIESLNDASCKFSAYPCKDYEDFKEGHCEAKCSGGDCPIMGYDAFKYKTLSHLSGKKLFLQTNAKAPFCKTKTKDEPTSESVISNFFNKLSSYLPW